MTFVSTSRASISTSSPTPRSDSLPTETSFAKPRPRGEPRESRVPMMVPLCEITLAPPRGRLSASKAAFTVINAPLDTFASPIEFGPMMRTPSDFASDTSSASRACPCGPVSANPSL